MTFASLPQPFLPSAFVPSDIYLFLVTPKFYLLFIKMLSQTFNPTKYTIKVLDAFSEKFIPYSKHVPLIYAQKIEINPSMMPPKPPSRS